jgi:SPFH domain / Band 7 family
VEVILVDVRERELTIKGQEILTADKVAIRVSIIVQFRAADPAAALRAVVNFEERLYSHVQLAARRCLATMTLEDILTNRTRLSGDILQDVKEAAGSYGVSILRADKGPSLPRQFTGDYEPYLGHRALESGTARRGSYEGGSTGYRSPGEGTNPET